MSILVAAVTCYVKLYPANAPTNHLIAPPYRANAFYRAWHRIQNCTYIEAWDKTMPVTLQYRKLVVIIVLLCMQDFLWTGILTIDPYKTGIHNRLPRQMIFKCIFIKRIPRWDSDRDIFCVVMTSSEFKQAHHKDMHMHQIS